MDAGMRSSQNGNNIENVGMHERVLIDLVLNFTKFGSVNFHISVFLELENQTSFRIKWGNLHTKMNF